MVTDLAEVFRLGTAKAEENVDFRRFLSAHHHNSDKPFQIIASEIEKQVDCTTCASCCRNSVVALSQADLQAIAGFLRITPQAVALLYTLPDPDAPARRVLSNAAEGCVFLDDNRCMIYEARPAACRNFPHVAVGSHSLGSRPASHALWAPLCPIVYNALERYKQVTGYRPRRRESPPPGAHPAGQSE